jgi:4-hydroxymandelate oxidase
MKHPQTSATPINLNDIEVEARQKLPKEAFDYYSSGAWDEITLQANQAEFRQIYLRPRMLVDVSQRQSATTILGQPVSMPILVAPMAFQGMAHEDGELATARGATASGTIMTLSTLANRSIEEVAAAAAGALWFQLYVYKDREISRNLVERAEAAGYKALVLTVDSPLLGRRERDVRNRFQLPPGLKMGNFCNETLERFPQVVEDSGLFAYVAALYDTALTWKDLEWFVSITKLPVLVKGILRADDALRAVDSGAAGVIVSNHGGRQLDTAVATIRALPEVAAAVGSRSLVLMDGGVRRGTDVLKAIALGAKAVLLGRPVLWGLAVDGAQGVQSVLETLHTEFDLAMALSGCASLDAITPDLLAPER